MKKQLVLKLYFLIILVIISSGFPILGQGVSVEAKLDSMLIFIGGQINMKLEISQPKSVVVNFPVLTDTISKNIEIVSIGKTDTTLVDNNRLLISKTLRITSFDSGVHLITALTFELADKQVQAFYQTREMAIKVINPFEEVDPKKGINDIKQPYDAPFKLSELLPYLPYIIGFLILIAAIVILVIWRFNRKLILPFLGKEKPIVPPHVIALNELERIKKENYCRRDLIKQYYIEISDCLRQYILARFNINAPEHTSEETHMLLKKSQLIDKDMIAKLDQILTIADLAKFAKYKPTTEVNDLNLINAVFFVNQTKQEEVVPIEEQKQQLKSSELITKS